MKYNKKLKILFWICVFVILCVYGFMVLSVNNKFPPSTIKIYQENEVFEFQGADFAVKKTLFLDENDIASDKNFTKMIQENTGLEDLEVLKYIIIDIQIKNSNDESLDIQLLPFFLESKAFSLQADLPILMKLNNTGMHITLQPNEQKTIKYPIPLYENFFTQTVWENIEQRDFYLSYSLYPVKQMVELNLK